MLMGGATKTAEAGHEAPEEAVRSEETVRSAGRRPRRTKGCLVLERLQSVRGLPSPVQGVPCSSHLGSFR